MIATKGPLARLLQDRGELAGARTRYAQALVLLDAADFPSRLGLLCEGLEALRNLGRPQMALYIGGMGRSGSTVLQAMRGLHPADIWLAILLGHLTRATLSVLRFRQGRWRNIAVDIEAARP